MRSSLRLATPACSRLMACVSPRQTSQPRLASFIRKSTQRIIPDVDYKPVKIVGQTSAQPLDLSFSVLRSVSPFHLQYMRNMGVHASMSISIVRERQAMGPNKLCRRTA